MNNDCLLCIVSLLDIRDIKNCTLVNKQFYVVVYDNILWSNLFKRYFWNVNSIKNEFYGNFKKYYILNKFLINTNSNVNNMVTRQITVFF